jgi:hypothetical protein
MPPTRHRRRSWVLWVLVVVLGWYREDVAATIRRTMSDFVRPQGELAGQLAMLAAIALLPVMLLIALLFVALDRIRRVVERILSRALPVALATLIAVRTVVVQPSPSPHVLRRRPVF